MSLLIFIVILQLIKQVFPLDKPPGGNYTIMVYFRKMKQEEIGMGLEMIDAGWLSILPPVVAITLALLTKEVYSSLFLLSLIHI